MKGRKIKMKFLRIIIFASIILLAACGTSYKEINSDMSKTINDFNFTTQSNEKLGLDDLKGKWWIADFIFTNCTTVCLPMTYHMSELQKALKETDIEVELVSFSVDPDYDTPEVLTAYGNEYGADYSTWHFLTGYDFKTIKEVSIKSFQAPLRAPERGDDQVLHDTRFFLVSPDGKAIKSYDGTDITIIEEIIEDLKTVQEK